MAETNTTLKQLDSNNKVWKRERIFQYRQGVQLATCLQMLLLLPSGSTWAFLPWPCSSWAALTKGWLWLQQRHWDLSISIQSWAHFEGNHCFGFPPWILWEISKSTLQSEVLPVQSYLCSSSFSQGRMHIMLWSFPFSISPPFSFMLWKHYQAKSLTCSICISVPASQRTQLTHFLLTLFLCGQGYLVIFLRMHTLQYFSSMYIWMYVFWMSIHQHISVYFLLKFHVFISMHTYSKITLFHTGSHSRIFSAYLYQCINAHYLRGK